MTDYIAIVQLLEKNNIPFRWTVIYNEENEISGSALWLPTGHFEFGLNDELKNVVPY